VLNGFLWPLLSDEKKLEDILKDSNKASLYPESPIYHFLYQKDIEKDQQGIIKETVQHFYQVLNQIGRDNKSDYRMRYNKESQTITVSTADTILKEGGIIAVEKGGINEVTPPELSMATIYANIVDKVYSFQKVRPEDGIHVQYQVQNREKTSMPYSGRFTMYQPEPGENIGYSVAAPAKLFYQKVGQVEVEEKGNQILFKIATSPFINPEPYSPPLDYLSPKVYFSETKDWSQILAPVEKDLQEKSKPNQEIKKFVKNLLKNTKTNSDKIHAIYNFMSKKTKKIKIPAWLSGYHANQAHMVLKNLYGDPKDLAVLMLALLKAAKLNAYPVLSSSSNSISQDIPNLDQYDGILVGVEEKGKWSVFDPFNELKNINFLMISGDPHGRVLKEDFPTIDLPQAENTIDTQVKLVLLDASHAHFKINLLAGGYCDFILRMKLYYKSNEEREKYFQGIAQGVVEGAQLKSFSLANMDDLCKNVEIAMDIEADNPAIYQKQVTFLTLPKLSIAAYPYDLFLDDRKNDLYLTFPVQAKIKWDIALEKGTRLIYLPTNVEGSTAQFKTKLACQYNANQSTLVLEKEIENLKKVYSLAEYKKLKTDLNNLDQWKNNTLLWEK
jgi:hypothetical protein